MNELSTTEEEIVEIAERFLWSEAKDFTAWITGEWKRLKRIEYNLPRMVKKGLLFATRYRKKLVYTLPGKRANYKADIAHGLVSTKALLRFKFSKDGEFVSERFIREAGFEAVSEWAAIWGKQIMLFEYSTADNFRRPKLMRKKLNQYPRSLDKIAGFFNAQPFVLFVFDAPRYKVKFFTDKHGRHEAFYFIDLNSFMDAGHGQQLEIPYIWGGDGKNYPLIPLSEVD